MLASKLKHKNTMLPDNVRCVDETVGQDCGDGAAKELSGRGHDVVDDELLASCTYVGRFDIGTEEIRVNQESSTTLAEAGAEKEALQRLYRRTRRRLVFRGIVGFFNMGL